MASVVPLDASTNSRQSHKSVLISAKEQEQLEHDVDMFLAEPDEPDKGSKCKEVLTFIGFMVLLMFFVYLAVYGYVQAAAVEAAKLGPLGHLIFIGLFIFVAMPFGWGYSIVIIAGGFSFGWMGIISAEVGTLVGSFLAYLVSKKALADWVRHKLKGMKPKTQKVLLSIELAIRSGKGGVGMQTGLRVNPVLPFGWTNAVLGIWEVGPVGFVLSTMGGCQVDIILKTNLGVIAKTVGDLNKQTPETKAIVQQQLILQCVVFAVVLVTGCLYSRWIMKNVMPEDGTEEADRRSRRASELHGEKIGGACLKNVENVSGIETTKSMNRRFHGGGKAQAKSGWRLFVSILFRRRGSVIVKVFPISMCGALLAFILVAARTKYPDLWLLPDLKHPFIVQIFSIILSFVIVARTNVALNRYYDGVCNVHTMGARWIDGWTSLLGFLRSSFDLHAEGSPKKQGCEALGLAMLHWSTLAHALAINSLQVTQLGLEEKIWQQRLQVLEPPEHASLSDPLTLTDMSKNAKSRGRLMKGAMTCELRTSIVCQDAQTISVEKVDNKNTRDLVKLGIYGELSTEEIVRLHGATDKCAIVLMWMEEAISRAQIQGILLTAPPILGRVYAEIGHGLQGFNEAYRIALVPFPFCFAQMIAWCLVSFLFLCPTVAFVFTGGEILTSSLTFASLCGFWGLNRIAMELENPFGCEVNHLPMAEMHHAFIEAVGEMHSHPMPEYEWEACEEGGQPVRIKRNMLS